MAPMTDKFIAFLLYPAVACLAALLLTRLCLWLMPRLGLVDMPGGRHIHKQSTPKGGGLAIILGFFLAWALFLHFGPGFNGSMNQTFMLKLLLPAAMLATLGFLDDKYNIRARYKLLCQLAVGAACWFMHIRMESAFGVHLPDIVSLPLTALWVAAFVNAFNLIDGIDGLAAGLGIVTSACMATIFAYQRYPNDALVIICLAAACLGFLRYNFHPARIFMGDTGSMFIGFMFAIVGIVSSAKIATFSAVLIPILAMGVPVFDMFLAIWRRLSRKAMNSLSGEAAEGEGGVMGADREHLHHRLLDRHKSQPKTTLVIYSIAIVFAGLAVMLVIMENQGQGLAFLMIVITFVTAIRRLATIELFNSTKAVVESFKKARRSFVISLAHPVVDLAILVGCFMLVFVALNPSAARRLHSIQTYWAMSYTIFPVIALFHLGGIYRRYWFRARSVDYLYLGELMLLGNLASFIACSLFLTSYAPFKGLPPSLPESLLFMFMSSSLIIGERMFLRYLRSTLYNNLYLTNHRHSGLKKVLAYGGGLRCYYFLSEKNREIESNPFEVIGILDDAMALWGQRVYGHKVLGGVDRLEDIYLERPFDKLVFTAKSISVENRAKVAEFCRAKHVELAELALFERPVPLAIPEPPSSPQPAAPPRLDARPEKKKKKKKKK